MERTELDECRPVAMPICRCHQLEIEHVCVKGYGAIEVRDVQHKPVEDQHDIAPSMRRLSLWTGIEPSGRIHLTVPTTDTHSPGACLVYEHTRFLPDAMIRIPSAHGHRNATKLRGRHGTANDHRAGASPTPANLPLNGRRGHAAPPQTGLVLYPLCQPTRTRPAPFLSPASHRP